MSKRVLITGASGFIAGHIVGELSKEYPLILVSRKELAYPFPVYHPSDLRKAFEVERPDVVINTAGILKETKGTTYREVHVEFTESLVELAKEFGVRKFIQISALGTRKGAPPIYHRTKCRNLNKLPYSKLLC